jgi:hypothetical protein
LTNNAPACTVVAPRYVLVPVSTVVPAPACVTLPLPEMAPPNVALSERLKTSAPLLATSPMIEPPAPPLPSCSVPAVMVVPPP